MKELTMKGYEDDDFINYQLSLSDEPILNVVVRKPNIQKSALSKREFNVIKDITEEFVKRLVKLINGVK